MKFDKTLFDRYSIVASPSQMVDLLDCQRKWWFRRVCRLPVLSGQEKFVFGNILHAVIQRWLLADERGRDPDGKPVDIYPTGWMVDRDENGKVNGEVNKREAQLIQMLVKNAIDSGLLRRTPGRKIERPFELEIVPGVGYIGALDIETPAGVEDHKSTKSRDWISSEKDLANDPKMLSYAEVWRREHRDAAQVALRLNYMVKDPDDLYTKPVDILVPASEVEKFWNETIVPAAEAMLKLKSCGVPATEWSRIPGPANPGVCKKYGGCTFAAICGRMKTPLRYSEEINRANGNLAPLPETTVLTPPPARQPMSIFNKNKKSAPVAAPAAAAPATPVVELVPQATPAPRPQPKPEPAPTPAPAPAEVPPWAVAKCVPCKGSGFSLAGGRACRACDAVSGSKGGPVSSSYTIIFNQDGTVSWGLKVAPTDIPEAPAPLPPKQAPAAPQAAKAPDTGSVQVTAPVKAARGRPPKVLGPKPTKPLAEVKAEPAAPSDEGSSIVKEVLVTESGRILDGFRLFINCMPLGQDFVDLAQVFFNEGAELANARGAESFYAMESFKRRDMLAAQVARVAREQLAGKDVVVIGGSQDLKAYAEALRPHASETFIGVF